MTGRAGVGYHPSPMAAPDVSSLSVAELRARYVDEGRPLPAGAEDALASDARAGARAVVGRR